MKTYCMMTLAFGGVLYGSTGCDLGDQNVGDEHETTGATSDDDGSDSSDGDSGTEGDSSGAVDVCDGYPFGATAEEIAATPRADADAEILALLTAGQLTAPEDLYQRVVDDLAAIRAENPMLTDHHARTPWGFGGIAVSFDEAGTQMIQAGTYEGWDCPNAHYGATAEPSTSLEDTAFIELGGKQLHMMRLMEEYRGLPNVIHSEVLGDIDGSYICLEPTGDVHRYLFALGEGDCPAGCTEWTYWQYTIDAEGVVTFDGESTMLPDGWTHHCVQL